MKKHLPEPPMWVVTNHQQFYNMLCPYLCRKKQKDDWDSVSSENGEQWANLRITVKKNYDRFLQYSI